MTQRDLKTENAFIERFGLMGEEDGLPRIAGRILAHMLMNAGPHHGDQLAEELQISHGSVSSNTRLLQRLGLIERVSFSGDRKAYFQLSADPYGRLLDGSVARMRRMQELVAETRRAISATNPVAKKRLGAMERFYTVALTYTEKLLERWQAEPRPE